MMKKLFLFACACTLIQSAFSQKVFWASKVVNFSSQYGSKEYGAQQILGPPNGMPYYERSLVSWTPASQSNQAYITVEFEQATQVQQIAIGENLMSGAIEKIFLYDTKGKEYLVYENSQIQSNRPQADDFFNHFIPLTPYKTQKLKLQLKYASFKELPQIDCIGISPDAKKITPQINTIHNSAAIPQPENLGSGVNSQYHDMLPIISPDGKTLYFARKNSPDNIGAARKDDIYVSQRQATGSWSRAINIGPPLNTDEHNFVCAISPDGNTMYLANKYDYRTEAQGVAVSYKQKNGTWSKPTPLNIANMYNKHKYACYHLSIDEKVLVMAIERDDTQGDMDLYVSFRYADGNWTEPMNMGPDLNTAGAEASVFLAADSRTLYFSSNGHNGYGDLDMYMSRRLDNTWKNWSTPVNLGSKINTVGMDIYYTIPASGDYAYYSSERAGYGLNDIYRIALPKELRPDAVRLDPALYVSNETEIPTLKPYKTAEPSDLDKRIEELKRQLNGTNPNTEDQNEVVLIQKKESQLEEDIQKLERQYQSQPAYTPDPSPSLPSYTPTTYYDPSYDQRINELKRQLEKVKIEQPVASAKTTSTTASTSSVPDKSLQEYEKKLAQYQTPTETKASNNKGAVPKKELSAYEEKLKQLQAAQSAPAPEVNAPVRINGTSSTAPAKEFFEEDPTYLVKDGPQAIAITTNTTVPSTTSPQPEKSKDEKPNNENNTSYTPIYIPKSEDNPTITQSSIPVAPSLHQDENKLKEMQALEDSIKSLQNQRELMAQNQLMEQQATNALQQQQKELLSEKDQIALAIEQMRLEKEQLALEKERLENERKKLEAVKNQQYKDINTLKRELDSLQKVQSQQPSNISSPMASNGIDAELHQMKKVVGEKIALKNVYFVVNASFIQEKSYADLDKLAAYLINNKELFVEIGGHTNGLCDDAFCNELSNKRAKSVMDYLISKGIPSSRLSYRGYGKTQNIADNNTEQGRRLNQRVEVKIVKVQ